MTRDQRLVWLLVLAGAIVVIFAVAGRTLSVQPTPTYVALPEAVFTPVPAPPGAPRHVDGPPPSLGRDGGLRGVPVVTARPSVSAPEPLSTDAAVGGKAQTPRTAPASGPRGPERPSGAISVVSWYDNGPGYYAAAGDWRWGDTPYPLVLTRIADGRTYSVTVIVSDACNACRDGHPALDISPAAFESLGVPLSAGLVRVGISRP